MVTEAKRITQIGLRLDWNNLPAHKGLLEDMLTDMGIDDYTPQAQQAARNYFTNQIKYWQENDPDFKMAELQCCIYAFLDGYDAGVAGNTNPKAR